MAIKLNPPNILVAVKKSDLHNWILMGVKSGRGMKIRRELMMTVIVNDKMIPTTGGQFVSSLLLQTSSIRAE